MIYLDANAGSQLRPVAAEALARLFASGESWRNPSSVHTLGRNARAKITQAKRELVALLFPNAKCDARVVFTSGGTESCNSLVFGFLGSREQLSNRAGHIVTSAIEHPAILEPLSRLEQVGWEICYVSPQPDGSVRNEEIIQAVRENTDLVCLMLANNEIGTIQDVIGVAISLRENGYRGPIVSDTTQAVGKTDICMSGLFNAGVTAIAVSGHKLGASTGVGAVVISKEQEARCFLFESQLMGGPQEERFRAGTENLPGIVSLGETARFIAACGEAERAQVEKAREVLWRQLSKELPELVRLSGAGSACLGNTLSIRFPGCRADDLVVALDLMGVCVSTGAACASGKQELSHVLLSMGLSENEARQVIRISLDWDSNDEQMLTTSEIIVRVVTEMKESTRVLAA